MKCAECGQEFDPLKTTLCPKCVDEYVVDYNECKRLLRKLKRLQINLALQGAIMESIGEALGELERLP